MAIHFNYQFDIDVAHIKYFYERPQTVKGDTLILKFNDTAGVGSIDSAEFLISKKGLFDQVLSVTPAINGTHITVSIDTSLLSDTGLYSYQAKLTFDNNNVTMAHGAFEVLTAIE